ncbi:MAG: hypothetical protein MR332_06490 [Fusicatenibacter sp.]|nr:hypothetical protein [Fusicatenibacter sp.]
MRKSILSIGYLCAVFLIMAGFFYSYHLGEERENDEKKQKAAVSFSGSSESLIEAAVEADAMEKARFVLGEEDGRILVLLEDGHTVYEYTDIRISDLPESVQEEVYSGKTIENAAELYSFLENYSS